MGDSNTFEMSLAKRVNSEKVKPVSEKKAAKLQAKANRCMSKLGYKVLLPSRYFVCPKAMAHAHMLMLQDAEKHDPSLADNAEFVEERDKLRAITTMIKLGTGDEVPLPIRIGDLEAAIRDVASTLDVIVTKASTGSGELVVEEILELSASLQRRLANARP